MMHDCMLAMTEAVGTNAGGDDHSLSLIAGDGGDGGGDGAVAEPGNGEAADGRLFRADFDCDSVEASAGRRSASG